MSKSIKEAGLKLASSKNDNVNRGTIFLDRTIYYTIPVTDSNGKQLFYDDGDPIVNNTVYRLAGSYLSPESYEIAMQIEKDFKELNELFRKDMERRGIKWRLKKSDQKTLSVQGIT